MSKSKRNTIDPLPIVDQYGADAVRWFVLSDSPPERDLPWSEAGIDGAWRFVQRLWRIVEGASGDGDGDDLALRKLAHRTIAGVGDAIEGLQFNKAVALLYTLANAIEKAAPSRDRRDAARTLLLLASPMTPHLAEEAWAVTGEAGLIAEAVVACGRPRAAGRRRSDDRGAGQRQAARHADAAQGRRARGCGSGGAGVGQGRQLPRRQGAQKGYRRARSSREPGRMKRAALLLALALPGCGLHPLYAGGAGGQVARGLAGVEVAPIQGKGGWLVASALRDRIGAHDGAARYRLDVRLDDQIAGLGVRRDDSVSRERRTLRARYQLVDPASGAVLFDATAGSDAGIDVVGSEYATIAAENTALERLAGIVADQIVGRVALYARAHP